MPAPSARLDALIGHSILTLSRIRLIDRDCDPLPGHEAEVGKLEDLLEAQWYDGDAADHNLANWFSALFELLEIDCQPGAQVPVPPWLQPGWDGSGNEQALLDFVSGQYRKLRQRRQQQTIPDSADPHHPED